MIFDAAKQAHNFEKHVATFTDCGNIKILDFKDPESVHYRIRFMFEEDHYRLHITGDLGDLVASNYSNMCWEGFKDFVNNVGYFEGKVDTCSRPLYEYDENLARKEILERFDDDDFYRLEWRSTGDTLDEIKEDILGDILEDFSGDSGIGPSGCRILEELDPDCWEYAYQLGRERTGILELYLYAFDLAKKQLDERPEPELKDEGFRLRCTNCNAEIDGDIANLVDKRISYCPVCGVKWSKVPWSGGKYDT